jgi:hypothetical protein
MTLRLHILFPRSSFFYSIFVFCLDNICTKFIDTSNQTKHSPDNTWGADMKKVGIKVVAMANTIALHDLPNRLAIIPTISLPRKRSSSSNGAYTYNNNI